MAEFLEENTERFGKTVEYSSPDELAVRISTHERPKDADPTATFVVPGWTGTPEVYAPVHGALFEDGRNVVSFKYADEMPDAGLDAEELARARKFPTEQRRKALSLIKSIQYTRGVDRELDRKVDIVAHSEGFAVAVMAAAIRPALFRDIIAYGPIGATKNENWLRLLAGFIGQNFEKPDWGPGPTDMKDLAREYAGEQRHVILKQWSETEGKDVNEAEREERFKEYFDEFTSAMEARLTAKKEAARVRGIEEFTAPTDGEHAEAARRRTISDSAFFRHLTGRRWRSFQEARAMPSFRLQDTMRELSDEHGIGFAIAIGGNDSVMKTWRKKLSVIKDVLTIHKRKPRVETYSQNGTERQRTVFDPIVPVVPVVKTLSLPGGHQAIVGYRAIIREIERALTRLNRERI